MTASFPIVPQLSARHRGASKKWAWLVRGQCRWINTGEEALGAEAAASVAGEGRRVRVDGPGALRLCSFLGLL